MSLLFSRAWGGLTAERLVAESRSLRTSRTPFVSPDSAMRSSAVWACLRMRADMVSTTPLNQYRKVGSVEFPIPSSPFLLDPGGKGRGVEDWLYASQMDLDRSGNAIGTILARDGQGLPAVVELAAADKVGILGKGDTITKFRINGTLYEPGDVWHERQYVVPGIPLGLSPIAYGAYSIGNYLSAQEFVSNWFTGGGASMPSGHLKNTGKILVDEEAQKIKARFRASVASGDVFVSGEDWEFTPVDVTGEGAAFLQTMQYGIADIARFMGLPADLIDAVGSKGTITYANVVQRNLQALIWYLQPVFERREAALSRATPKPRFVKFGTDAILRMDPPTRGAMLNAAIAAKRLAPSEARAQDNLPPFTPAQIQEFHDLGIVADPAASVASPFAPEGLPA
jgi:HK97 family phage portal protein